MINDLDGEAGIDCLLGFGEFLVFGAEEQWHAKNGGLCHIMKAFSECTADDGYFAKTVAVCELANAVKDKDGRL